MSYLRCLCLLGHGGVQHILCCALDCVSSSVASFPGLAIFDCPFGNLHRLFNGF